ncbi:MAG: lysophospholipid acyltransferase family protein [Gammaproteobacteria bacterium]|nr:lysophospholipid acyltransferase family protein [Gammaproteobacteria bacterium]MDH3758237.1 lysophospholipid acyltransferase family protein [Gammaproteobacteria bacterium]MDH3846918.1 lysophospholipid acyltransferase family protein [Gammaproteobacteria bacterium]NCF60790.1 DUF374 domain-containing protein [Gammaproteobacteria bacterium]
MSDKQPVDFDSVESRRSSASMRRMTLARRLYYSLGLPLLRLINWALLKSYRFEPVIGEEHATALLAGKTVSAPSYWHQHHVVCSAYMRSWLRRGYKLCFLISGSVDGEVPERIAHSWGAEVIRGSANQSGALALRDQQHMLRNGYSIVTTADGPRGPKYEFKSGTVLMARIAGVPIVPIACAADRAWYLNRWDDFMIPKPFARVVVAVGEPYLVSRDVKLDEIEPHRLNVQRRVMSLMQQCEEALDIDSGART